MTTLLTPNQFFSLEEYSHVSLFEGCQYPWQALEYLKNYFTFLKLGNIEVDIPSSVYLVHPELISIGVGTVIEPGAYIEGPCVIGKNCIIRHGAYIRGDVVTGDSCVIGHDTEVKHSIFFNSTSAAHFNYVGDSILGNRVNLGAGVKCANLRLDHQPIHVLINNERINTGLHKLGAIVGDGAQVGCNCVINPGTILGRHSFCFPCLNVYGFIPENGKVKPPMKNVVE
jgi:UDP-N-acetylglucosamine diphosphorylase / glucose-1-phosphate thymidylyltransferase / UDP-N-acetylgalactosamine diphosphorylase / glucosamine-1-phosphate N-acetyltransferase / galactosamine-1-phosphate N-acetyltransferase